MSIHTDKLSVFVNEWQSLAGQSLRHPTAGTLLLLEQADNPLLAEKLPALIEAGTLNALDLIAPLAQYIVLHSRPLAEVRQFAANDAAAKDAMFAAADALPAHKVIEYALSVNAALKAMHATRDWEVAGQSGGPFTPPSGQPSTSQNSPS